MTYPRLYLVRHGETDWNAEGRLLSFTDAPLNARGEEQAAGLASALAAVRWDRAVSSPLLRARRTAEVVLTASSEALRAAAAGGLGVGARRAIVSSTDP